MVRRLAGVCAVLVLSACGGIAAAQDSASSCLPVLQAKDYYRYAQQNSLMEDYLRSIDSETWRVIQTSNSFDFGGVFSGGVFSLSDDYKTFDQKRTKYLENVHYTRSEQSAREILSITVSPRAFSAYEECLRSLADGPPIRVWASSEDMDVIHLRVKYANNRPYASNRVYLDGYVTGGSVNGVGNGKLWKSGGSKWINNQEKLITINRPRGVSTTRVVVTARDGSAAPVDLAFSRADGILSVKYVGTTDVMRYKDHHAYVGTPDNNENRGNCPNMVGKHDGKYCTSRTTTSLTITAPRFLKNARPVCLGGGCPWTSWVGPASISANGLTAAATLDNWGSAVTVGVVADEYEQVGSQRCGGDHAVPVLTNQTVVFSVPKECLAIATVQWALLPDHQQGVIKFGDQSAPGGMVLMEGTVRESGSDVIASYKLGTRTETQSLLGQ